MDIKQDIESQIAEHREFLLSNLGFIGDHADKPLPEGKLNLEEAIIIRMREIGTVVNEQHSRLHQIKALKGILRKAKRRELVEARDAVNRELQDGKQ